MCERTISGGRWAVTTLRFYPARGLYYVHHPVVAWRTEEDGSVQAFESDEWGEWVPLLAHYEPFVGGEHRLARRVWHPDFHDVEKILDDLLHDAECAAKHAFYEAGGEITEDGDLSFLSEPSGTGRRAGRALVALGKPQDELLAAARTGRLGSLADRVG